MQKYGALGVGKATISTLQHNLHSWVHQHSTHLCSPWKLSRLGDLCNPIHVPSLHLQARQDLHFESPLQLASESSVLCETFERLESAPAKPEVCAADKLHHVSILGTLWKLTVLCYLPHPQISNSADSGVDSDSFVGKTSSRVDGPQEQGSIGSVLQKIVNRASGKGPPLSAFLDSAENKASPVLKQVLDSQVTVEPKSNISFLCWIEYLELLAPLRQSKDSELAVKNILQILNEKQYAKLQSIKTRLSVPDVVEVLNDVENPTAAFVFYKWVRRQSFYIPHKSIYTAVIEQLIRSTDLDLWDQLHVVMNGMIKRKVFIDNLLFRRLLNVLCVYGLKHPCSIPRTQRYVDWLLRMSKAGFVSWLSTYKIVMKRCNILGIYESTLSVYEGIPMNTESSTLALALFACKSLNSLYLAEELVHKMKWKNVELDAKCFNIVLRLCADHGQADKAQRYFEQAKELGVLLDERSCMSVIHAYGKVGWVKQAEDIFQSLKGKLSPGIYRAMAACYRDAGYFNELLALLREANSVLEATCLVSAFEACVEKGQWKIAVEIIKDMQAYGMSPEPRLHHLILLACSKVDDYSACEGLEFDVREMEFLSSAELERIVKMSLSMGRVSSALDALELLKEPQFDLPTDKFFDDCICLSFKMSLPNATGMYNVMRSVGHLPSPSVFTLLIQEHIKVGDMLSSRKIYDDMLVAGLQPEEHITTVMQNSNKETLQNSTWKC